MHAGFNLVTQKFSNEAFDCGQGRPSCTLSNRAPIVRKVRGHLQTLRECLAFAAGPILELTNSPTRYCCHRPSRRGLASSFPHTVRAIPDFAPAEEDS